jgi:hypothetical protein
MVHLIVAVAASGLALQGVAAYLRSPKLRDLAALVCITSGAFAAAFFSCGGQ